MIDTDPQDHDNDGIEDSEDDDDDGDGLDDRTEVEDGNPITDIYDHDLSLIHI